MYQHVPSYRIPKRLPTLIATTDAIHEGIHKGIWIPASTAASPGPTAFDTVCEIMGDAGVFPLMIAAGGEAAVAGNGALWYFEDVNCESCTYGALGGDLRYRDSSHASNPSLRMA